jgi:arabinofuranosyltransferase
METRLVKRFDRLEAALVMVAVALLAGVFVWELVQTPSFVVDDAYITFSYSRNLALGHGPVYGHGVRVEGYSNFLWMLVVAAGLLFQRAADPLLVARIAAVPFLALLGFTTYRLCRLRAGRMWSLVPLALLAINQDVMGAFLVGLETIAYVALLTLAFLLYLRSIADERLRRWVVPALVAVALTRIDGFVPLGFVLLFEAARRLGKREGTPRDYLMWALPALAVYAGWFAWRWSYYGLPLPTTYYAKALIPKVLPHRGWEYVRDECTANASFLVLPFAVILLARRRVEGLFVILFAALQIAYVIKVGGDWMPYGRFLLPILPLLLVTVVWGGGELCALLRPWWRRQAALLMVLPLAALAVVARRTERHLTDSPLEQDKQVHSESAHVKSLKAAARLLNRALPPGARLVTDYGGVFAYYTDAAPIEMWGLCNATIARKGGLERINPVFGRTCPACYVELDPQFFHTMMPITRDLQAFHSHAEVINAVWQTDTIGRYLDFQRGFVSGRAMIPIRNQAVYFLERRRPGVVYRPRAVGDQTFVDYPFEPGGRASGL